MTHGEKEKKTMDKEITDECLVPVCQQYEPEYTLPANAEAHFSEVSDSERWIK